MGVVDGDRVVAHFDIDCFYAQSEELRCPSLRGRPVGVTQKFLVVTSNYMARDLGVPKMVSIADAKRMLPALVLINGEDLTPYRADSKRVMAVLRRFGTMERHGFDEGAVDITAEVAARLQSGNRPGIVFQGHVLGLPGVDSSTDGKGAWVDFGKGGVAWEGLSSKDIRVLVGGQIVSEMRAALENETGFRCSCGISGNKMLAKLASSLNKPSKQTCLLDGAVMGFLAPLSVRKIPGVGKQMQGGLTELGVETMADLGKVSYDRLSEKFGPRIGLFLFEAGMGRDSTPVLDKGPPKSISVEDSFRNCKTMQRASEILRGLAPDLVRRLDDDGAETGRKPKTLTLKWRVNGSTWNFSSTSQKTPPDLLNSSVAVEKRAQFLADMMAKLLARTVKVPFDLVVLNIGVTNFVDGSSAELSPGGRDIRSFMSGNKESPVREMNYVSKRDARVRRESFKPMAVRRSLEPGGFFAGGAAPKRKLEDSHDFCLLSTAEDDFYPSNCSSEGEVEQDEDFPLEQFGLYSAGQKEGKGMKAIVPGMSGGGFSSSLTEGPSLSRLNSLSRETASGVLETFTNWESSSSGDFDGDGDKGSGMVMNGLVTKSESSLSAEGFPASRMSNGAIPLFEGNGKGPSFRKGFPCGESVNSHVKETHSKMPLSDIRTDECRVIDTSFSPFPEHDETDWRSSTGGEISGSSCRVEETLGLSNDRLVMERDNDADVSLDDFPSRRILSAAGLGAHWTCEKCGKVLDDNPSARQEHDDYHFALSLDRPEVPSRQPRKAIAPAKKGRTTGQKSGTKSRTGTLDRFVVRLS